MRIAELSEQLKMERKHNEELHDQLVMLELKNQELLATLAKMDAKYTSEMAADGETPAADYSDPKAKRAAIEALIKKLKFCRVCITNFWRETVNESKRYFTILLLGLTTIFFTC